jgi:hypothetical protein
MISNTPTYTNWKELNLLSAKELRKVKGITDNAPDKLPGGNGIDEAMAILRGALNIPTGGKLDIMSPIGNVIVEEKWLAHIVEKRDAARERYAKWIIPAIVNPTEIWQSPHGEGDRQETRNRFIKLFSDGKNDMLIVVSIDRDNLLWNAIPMPTRSVDNQREGILLYQSYR